MTLSLLLVAQVELQPGLIEMIADLSKQRVRRAILTRNAPFAVDDFLERVARLLPAHADPAIRSLCPFTRTHHVMSTKADAKTCEESSDDGVESAKPLEESVGSMAEPLFHTVLTRDFEPCKPHPAPILAICKAWGIEPAGSCPSSLLWLPLSAAPVL